MNPKGGYVYIMSNIKRNVIYIGVTSSLYWRVLEHKNGNGSKFTSKYKCNDLIYYEYFDDIESAIKREKQLKKWKRSYKDELIKNKNPSLVDLTEFIADFL